MSSNKYREYFDIDEQYFPQINDYSIAAASPDFWTRTYPHHTFIEMLTKMERVLSRQEKRSLWIEGSYGTGKSQCAYTLKKILEVPEEELRDYWNRYEPLKKKSDLLEKLLGHKEKGIVTAHRYASGGISSPRDLFLAIQESVKDALVERNLDTGDNTLKESVIAWIDKPANKRWLNELLLTEYASLFSQSTADEVLNTLRNGKEIKKLMDNIFRLADKEGVTALSIDADRLVDWLTDVIDKNNIKIVFIWDEFSDYFKNNRESLSEFQKVVELVNLKPFYLIVVTHESGQLYVTANSTWKIVRDRFIPVNITLPDNIAFNLIGHAFNVKQSAKGDWDSLANDLNTRVNNSRNAVMKAAKIDSPQVMKDIMPLHPMAALLLKNIASAFQSNQRSMFDFIKSSNSSEVKAFQWFIEKTGPIDDHPLLTVDMLWNFFYEKGRDNLTSDIRLILDTFPQQQGLREDEKVVLKAILMMQAIDQRLGGSISLFKATDQNLSYVFEGIDGLEANCRNIAKGLKEKGVIISTPISGGQHVYVAAVLAGDQAKIDKHKKDVLHSSTTSKLVAEGGLASVLSLTPALRLRFESVPNTGMITPVSAADFKRTINILREKQQIAWGFNAVIAFAKDDAEAAEFRNVIKATVANREYENIVFIDALSTPLGVEAFEQYLDYSAMAMYYNGNNNTSSRENSDKARHVLDQNWKNRIYNGPFIIYTYKNQEGEKLSNGESVSSVLQNIVTSYFEKKAGFSCLFDFNRNLTENQLKLTSASAAAKCGITQNSSGVVGGIERHILPTVWNVDKYWEKPALASLPISKIKVQVDKLIEEAFDRDGHISIGEIYDFLEENYGYPPCNLSAFTTGFLLKEYALDPYRYSDSTGCNDSMSPDKLKEMIGNYIGKNPKAAFIVKMTPEEMAFYKLTEKAWKIIPNSCSSLTQAVNAVNSKMREFGLPVWCIAEVDDDHVFDAVQKYIELIQKEGKDAHKMAIEIGKIAIMNPVLSDKLSVLITRDNCQKGMREFLKSFEEGKIITLAEEIGATTTLLSDIKRLFEVKHSCLWDKQTGENEIRKLLTDYSIVKNSNILLNSNAHSREEAFKEWRERLKFIGVSYEAFKAKFPLLTRVFDLLILIYQRSDILPDQIKAFHNELANNIADIRDLLGNEKNIFAEVYKPYLEDLSDAEIGEIKSKLTTSMFELSKTESNVKVKASTEEYRKNQIKTKLFNLWRNKTDTKNPSEWSRIYRTPIICCVEEKEFEIAKKTFDTLNRGWGTESEIKDAIAFLESTQLFDVLSDQTKRNEAFVSEIIGEYRSLLQSADKIRDALERLNIDTYDWRANPSVAKKIKELAEAEYFAGGSDKAVSKIDKMDDIQLKLYLKKLVKNNMTVGIEIITSEGD